MSDGQGFSGYYPPPSVVTGKLYNLMNTPLKSQITFHCGDWRLDAEWPTELTYANLCCSMCHNGNHVKKTVRKLIEGYVMGIPVYKHYIVCCRVNTFCLKEKKNV